MSVGLIIAFLLLALFVYIVYIWIAAGPRGFAITGTFPGSRTDAKDAWSAEGVSYLGRQGYRFDGEAGGTLTFGKTYRPAWIILPIIFLFPLGLIALVHTVTDTITASFTEDDKGASIVIEGRAPRAVSEELHAISERLEGDDLDEGVSRDSAE